MGNVRTFLAFDILYRYLKYSGYDVRYVRNITDVGHLSEEEGEDGEDGEDKVEKEARLRRKDPMEIVQAHTESFHRSLKKMNFASPTIEPRATGHIPEQIALIEALIKKGFAYPSNGSVYFDLNAYEKQHEYGCLSQKNTEALYTHTRALKRQEDKRHARDFVLWRGANKKHLMRWHSPWGEGVPGWHLECSAMSIKYLGDRFDLHGGGMDLKFPHHECEIAQGMAARETRMANYWLHVNMLEVNGQKMSKSLRNSLRIEDLEKGTHGLGKETYHGYVLRFFMLQGHYRSVLNLTEEGLNHAKVGYMKLINGLRLIKAMRYAEDGGSVRAKEESEVLRYVERSWSAMADDLNTAKALGELFMLLKKINALHHGRMRYADIGKYAFGRMKKTYVAMCEDILGLTEPSLSLSYGVIEGLTKMYKEAKSRKDDRWVEELRGLFKSAGLSLQDLAQDRVDWSYGVERL